MRKLLCAFVFALFIIIPAVLLTAPIAHALQTTINVTSTDQEEPFIANGNCTLAEALASVSADAQIDNCVPASGAYGTGGPFVINLAAGAAAEDLFAARFQIVTHESHLQTTLISSFGEPSTSPSESSSS